GSKARTSRLLSWQSAAIAEPNLPNPKKPTRGIRARRIHPAPPKRLHPRQAGGSMIRFEVGIRMSRTGRNARGLRYISGVAPLLTVRRYASVLDARLAQARLQANGIRSFLPDEQVASIDPLLVGAIGHVRLQVPRDEVERAVDV